MLVEPDAGCTRSHWGALVGGFITTTFRMRVNTGAPTPTSTARSVDVVALD